MKYLCIVHVYMLCTCTRMHYAAIHVHFPLSSRDVTNACIICSAALWFKYFLIRLIFLIWNDDMRTMLEIWGFRVIVELNITPKFRFMRVTNCNKWKIKHLISADAFQIEETVFSSFNFKKFCLIQLRISWIHFSSIVIHKSACSWEDLKVM